MPRYNTNEEIDNYAKQHTLNHIVRRCKNEVNIVNLRIYPTLPYLLPKVMVVKKYYNDGSRYLEYKFTTNKPEGYQYPMMIEIDNDIECLRIGDSTYRFVWYPDPRYFGLPE